MDELDRSNPIEFVESFCAAEEFTARAKRSFRAHDVVKKVFLRRIRIQSIRFLQPDQEKVISPHEQLYLRLLCLLSAKPVLV